jgi:hypothetical protein
MSTFRFPLEYARQYRIGRMEAEERTLGALLEQKSALVQSKRQIADDCREREVAVIRSPSMDGEVIGALDAYRSWTKRQQRLLEGRIAESDVEIAAQRERVQSARRDLELLNKLKERRRREWRKREDAELESLAAEVFLAKWAPE